MDIDYRRSSSPLEVGFPNPGVCNPPGVAKPAMMENEDPWKNKPWKCSYPGEWVPSPRTLQLLAGAEPTPSELARGRAVKALELGHLVLVDLPGGGYAFRRMSAQQEQKYRQEQATRQAWADYRWRKECEDRLLKLCLWNNEALALLRKMQAENPNLPPQQPKKGD